MPNIDFDQFRALAARAGLKAHERIDDPHDVRATKIDRIVADIVSKLPAMPHRGSVVVDIGPGCGSLASAIIEHCRGNRHQLWLLDSAEMLAHLPDVDDVRKVPGKFPNTFHQLDSIVGKTDAVLAYSMLHYVFEHDNIWEFLDRALALLAPGGCLLVGDIPNWSKRKRMLSARGQNFPWFEARAGEVWPGGLTDAVLAALMARAAESGFDPYLLPQPDDLPMAGWRVDLLFRRPSEATSDTSHVA